ncbi:MAG: hypothetical protein WBH01_06175 [Dehalococcoidia bacterium]|jgi:3-oxoacyl-(acyl-carrier-protein) synthase
MLANKPNEARIVITGVGLTAPNANNLSEIVGYAINSDVSSSILSDKEGQIQRMKLALDKAGKSPEDIGIINSHGTGTVEGDAAECEQLENSSVSIPTPI